MSAIPLHSSIPTSGALRVVGAPAAAAPPVLRIASDRLLAGRRELVIQHQGSEYHLRLTRNDKLILTK